jgi:bifunctional NMN adenylyltransferase/nudix hydrolase
MANSLGTGVIVGRFQVYDLNEAQLELIESVKAAHDDLLIFLGSSPAPSDQNPLEFPLRAEMFLNRLGEDVNIFEMPDHPDDRIWSQELDRLIMSAHTPNPVVIYGTKEGFVDRYSGKYRAEELEVNPQDIPDTLEVDGIKHLSSFRAGIIYATLRRFPTVYPTVDVAVFSKGYSRLLLARKPNENKYRLPGGFTDPTDESYEMAALRELAEECGDLEVSGLLYIGSHMIQDWRYLGSLDGIITHLYVCELEYGTPEPSDDIEELQWFDVSKLEKAQFVPEHQELWSMLKNFLEEEL